MTTFRTAICLVFIAALTFTTGLSMSRYETALMKNSTEFAELMRSIPEEFGNAEDGIWKRTKAAALPHYAVDQLKVRDAEHWTYVNDKTEERVNVSFLIGPTGRLSVHTPEVCLAGGGYQVHRERVREEFEKPEQEAADPDTFWRVSIINNTAPDVQFVVYYGLGTGKQWWAKETPRYELAKFPFILKLQVETVTTSDPEQHNSAREFLKAFLPEIAKVYAETDLEGMYR